MEHLGTAHLLDEDATLRELLTDREVPAARRALTATLYGAESGTWRPESLLEGEARPFGLLLLDGLMMRDVLVAGTTCGELVGPGDLLRPWDNFGDRAPMPLEIEWNVVKPIRLALLDQDFGRVLSMWPRLVDAFIERAVERSHALALHVAIHCIRRVDLSLLVLFSHLADRFGKVTPSGIMIPVELTQRELGKLVGATRQSTSTALGQLNERGAIVRREDGSWLIPHDAPDEICRMVAQHQRRPMMVAGSPHRPEEAT